MVSRASAPATPERAPDACAHHWRIDTPAGETSQGVCKLCGATRAFANYTSGRTMARPTRAPAPAARANSA